MYFGRCLVTGATGWLGPYVVAALEAGGNEVVAVGRQARPFVEGFDSIVHLAPVPPEAFVKLGHRFLYVSSGAVAHKPDTYLDGYGVAKRQGEAILEHTPRTQVARLYSVLGPGIPLDAHYAASSFLSQAIAGGPVVVHDGAVRSYLHPKDVASALLTILAHGDGEPYDVGGETPMYVSELGRRIAWAAGVEYVVGPPADGLDVYWPNLARLKALGWRQTIGLDAMIEETLESLKVVR